MSSLAASIPHAAPKPGPVSGRLSDTWTLTLRVLLFYKNSPGLIGVSLAAPLLMLVVFGYVFGSAIQTPGGESYRTYLMPGLFVLIAVNSVMASMVGAARDLDRGMTDRLRTMPISRGATLLGQALADLLVSAVILAAMVSIGLAVGWRVHDGPGKAAAALGILFLLRFAMVWVGFYLGLLCGREEIAAQAGLLVFPIGMVSNVFVPTAGMPGWLRVIADWNPISCVAAACRSLFGDTTGAAPASPWPLAHPVEAALGGCVLLFLVFAPLAVHRFSAHGRCAPTMTGDRGAGPSLSARFAGASDLPAARQPATKAMTSMKAPMSTRSGPIARNSERQAAYALASSLARPLVSGTSDRRAGTASIQVIMAPSASHAAQTGSSPQLTPGEFPQVRASPSRAAPAIHAPAHAAARSQLAGRQPRSLMAPAVSTGRGRASHAAPARTAAICTVAGPALNPMIPVPIMSAEMYWLVVA